MHSDAFEFSQQWLRQSNEVRQKVGAVEDVRLDPWGGFTEEVRGSNRRAWVSAVVTGIHGKIQAELELERRDDVWSVVKCDFAQIDSD